MYKKVSAKIIMILAAAAILTVPSSVLQVSYSQTDQDMQTVLDVHNQERAAVEVQPLTWSNNLADGAQTWAQEIATTGNFKHDPVVTGLTCTGPCYGENIAGFNPSQGPSAPGEGVNLWVNEKSSYHGGPVDLYVNGHYTQMVWQATTEVGCATAPPGAGGLPYSILVCRYDPPGNGEGLPYGGPAQAMGEEDAAAPLQEEGAAAPFDDQGAAAPPDADGGDDGGGGGGGDTSGDGGGNEN
jgi:pathogenesis-related protein 1